jgi:hypothetical protein
MLLWIDGPFGGGKTATAYELNRRLPGSVVCDPEHAGFGMLRMLPLRCGETSRICCVGAENLCHLAGYSAGCSATRPAHARPVLACQSVG